MGIKEMQGTPAYLEYIGPKGRKHRKKCIYNEGGICKCGKSNCYILKCVGRMYCKYYDDNCDNSSKSDLTFAEQLKLLSKLSCESEAQGYNNRKSKRKNNIKRNKL